MAHVGFPVIGDPLYGHGPVRRKGLPPEAADAINAFPRQALHARTLKLVHPLSGEALEFQAPLAADIANLIAALEAAGHD
jgi:23S rRNA pseudouridine1911/1915/1917 synthase